MHLEGQRRLSQDEFGIPLSRRDPLGFVQGVTTLVSMIATALLPLCCCRCAAAAVLLTLLSQSRVAHAITLRGMLRCLQRAQRLLLRRVASLAGGVSVGADELFPVMLFAVSRGSLGQRPLALLALLRGVLSPALRTGWLRPARHCNPCPPLLGPSLRWCWCAGELGYCLSNVEAAMEYFQRRAVLQARAHRAAWPSAPNERA